MKTLWIIIALGVTGCLIFLAFDVNSFFSWLVPTGATGLFVIGFAIYKLVSMKKSSNKALDPTP
ncbi:MAG: hypothetical protein AAF555_10390 [Verrucomicrobiota bacterium]